MEEATTFGLDATRREQEEETPIRGPRTVATESPFAPVSTSYGSGTRSPAGSNEQTGPDRTSV